MIVCFCLMFFVGCTFPLSYSINKPTNVPYVQTFTENAEIEFEETPTIADIIDAYLDITFTVYIYPITEKTENGVTTTSKGSPILGSGFIIHSGGFIITNDHVVTYLTEEPDTTTTTTGGILGVTTTTTTYYKCYVSQDGGATIHEAELLWNNPVYDMGIIVCEDFAALPAAKLKDRTIYCEESEKLKTYEEFIMVGNQKEDPNCYATGHLASNELKEAISADSGNFYEHLIKHAVTINHGSSGSPLIDLNGDVVGINTLGDDNGNEIFFAVSIYPAIAIIDAVVENYSINGETTEEAIFGFKGTDALRVANSTNPEVDFTGDGLYVAEVNQDCIVQGLQAGDVIVGLNIIKNSGTESFEVWDNNTFMYARIHLLYAQSGSVVVLRNGQNITLNLTV